jgi:chorismate mutase / prephenate dehydratase
VTDEVLEGLRAEITGVDREILSAVNRRLALVERLKRHKDEHGIAFVDPDREARMVAERLRENAGPLSDEGLRAFYAELLELCKRELA